MTATANDNNSKLNDKSITMTKTANDNNSNNSSEMTTNLSCVVHG